MDETSDQLRQLADPQKPYEYNHFRGGLSMDAHGTSERLNLSRGNAVTGPCTPPHILPLWLGRDSTPPHSWLVTDIVPNRVCQALSA